MVTKEVSLRQKKIDSAVRIELLRLDLLFEVRVVYVYDYQSSLAFSRISVNKINNFRKKRLPWNLPKSKKYFPKKCHAMGAKKLNKRH